MSVFHCISLHLNSGRGDHLEVIKAGSYISSHPNWKSKGSSEEAPGRKGPRPPWDPVQGLRASAPSPPLPPVRTGARSPSSSSGVQERGCVQSKTADENLQKPVSKTSFHDRGPSRGLPARAADCGAHTLQRRRGMSTHPRGRSGSRQVRPLGAPARPAPSALRSED